jgi:hypothetical protein
MMARQILDRDGNFRVVETLDCKSTATEELQQRTKNKASPSLQRHYSTPSLKEKYKGRIKGARSERDDCVQEKRASFSVSTYFCVVVATLLPY